MARVCDTIRIEILEDLEEELILHNRERPIGIGNPEREFHTVAGLSVL